MASGWPPSDGPAGLTCGMCGMKEYGQMYRIPELMRPICATCYSVVVKRVDPMPVTLNPRHCYVCGRSEETGPLFHAPHVPFGNGLCSTCLHHYHNSNNPGSMYVRAALSPQTPKPLSTDPYQFFQDHAKELKRAVDRLAGLQSPAGVQSGENSTGPKVMRYMDREETIAYVAAWLRWVGSLSMSKPRFHHILRLNPPDEVSEPPDPRKEDEQP